MRCGPGFTKHFTGERTQNITERVIASIDQNASGVSEEQARERAAEADAAIGVCLSIGSSWATNLLTRTVGIVPTLQQRAVWLGPLGKTPQRLRWTARNMPRLASRFYTQHAIERMMPSGLSAYGRSIAPAYVEAAIETGTTTTQVVDGVTRTVYSSGTLHVVTEDAGQIVVTVENIH